jgi:hypothetical protein
MNTPSIAAMKKQDLHYCLTGLECSEPLKYPLLPENNFRNQFDIRLVLQPMLRCNTSLVLISPKPFNFIPHLPVRDVQSGQSHLKWVKLAYLGG